MRAQPSPVQTTSDRSSSSPGTWFSTISYKSRATSPLSATDLDGLVRAAQIRNRAESITGMVIYDDGQFLQWLEGPAENLKRVVDSINRDRRHADIEVLGEQPTPVRFFDGWALKLGQKSEFCRGDGNAAHAGIWFDLVGEAGRIDARPLPRSSSDRSPLPGPHKETTPAAVELAALLLKDNAAASAFIRDAAADLRYSRRLFQTLLEPTARVLGDFWAEDRCTEFDVTIGLMQLQTVMREINARAVRILKGHPQKVLIAPRPGEIHMLSAVLDAEVLWQAGWDVHCVFPNSDRELQDVLANDHFDALDLSLSPAMTRASCLPDLAVTISHARAASQNRPLAVVTSGRLFSTPEKCRIDIGADASSPSSSAIDSVIARVLKGPSVTARE